MASREYNGKMSCHDRERYLCRGPFIADLQTRNIRLNNRTLQVTPCTFDYLVTLLRYSPEPVSYRDLVELSQGCRLPQLDAQDMARMRIYILRKLIEPDQNFPRYIQAVPGYGYRLVF